jgi:hypothetical protein
VGLVRHGPSAHHPPTRHPWQRRQFRLIRPSRKHITSIIKSAGSQIYALLNVTRMPATVNCLRLRSCRDVDETIGISDEIACNRAPPSASISPFSVHDGLLCQQRTADEQSISLLAIFEVDVVVVQKCNSHLCCRSRGGLLRLSSASCRQECRCPSRALRSYLQT